MNVKQGHKCFDASFYGHSCSSPLNQTLAHFEKEKKRRKKGTSPTSAPEVVLYCFPIADSCIFSFDQNCHFLCFW